MVWKIELDQHAVKQLKKLDRSIQKRIMQFLSQRLSESKNPRATGKSLMGKLTGLWRYRVGDYRIICKIKDKEITILVIDIDHRKDVYK